MQAAEPTTGSAELNEEQTEPQSSRLSMPRQPKVPAAGAQHPDCNKLVEKIIKQIHRGQSAYGLEAAVVFVQPDSFGQLAPGGAFAYATPHLLGAVDGPGSVTQRCITAFADSSAQCEVRV